MQQIHNSIINNQNISSPLLVSSYTSDASRSILVRCTVNGISGGDDYIVYATLKEGGIGPENIMQPVNSYYINNGLSDITFPSIMIPVNSGDILKLYMQGLNNDTNIKIMTSWFDLAIASPQDVRIEMDTNSTKLRDILADTGMDGVVLKAAGLSDDAIIEIQAGLATSEQLAAIPTEPLLAANYVAPDNSSILLIKAKTDLIPPVPAPANEYDVRMAAIQSDLDNPSQYMADVSNLATGSSLSLIPTNPLLASDYVAPDNGSIADIKAKTQNIPATPAQAGEYDVILADIQGNVNNPEQYKADVSGLATGSSIAGISLILSEVQSAVGNIDVADILSLLVEGEYTLQDILQIISAVLFGKLSGGDTTTLNFRSILDDKNRVVATVNQDTGDRLSVTVTKD